MTSWSSKPHICCRSCGNKTRMGAALFSLLFGWWGVPWGFIMTPVQVVKNVAGIMRGSDHPGPSDELLTMPAIAGSSPRNSAVHSSSASPAILSVAAIPS